MVSSGRTSARLHLARLEKDLCCPSSYSIKVASFVCVFRCQGRDMSSNLGAPTADTNFFICQHLNSTPFFLTILEAGITQSRGQQIQFLLRAHISACRRLPSFCVLRGPFLSVCAWRESSSSISPFCYKGTNRIIKELPHDPI